MNEDVWLLVIVFVLWAVIALGYAFVPMFQMPGYAGVWGVGALIFAGLAVAVAVTARRRQPRPPGHRAAGPDARNVEQ